VKPGAPLPSLAVANVSGATNGPRGFITSAPDVRTFAWTEGAFSLQMAFDLAFPEGQFPWKNVIFTDTRTGTVMTAGGMMAWVQEQLLGGPDPFAAHGGKVPIPVSDDYSPDQVDPGQWVGYTRRQVCFIVAKSLIRANTDGYANGLARFLDFPVGTTCTARNGDFGRAFFYLLGACAADPTLQDGGQGPQLLVAKASEEPSVPEIRQAAFTVAMDGAGLRVCQYADGAKPVGIPVEPVPGAGCTQPILPNYGPGLDFMTGGLWGQALHDTSARWLGGNIYGTTCGLGGGQDERLMVYFPEVAALTLFLSENPGGAGNPPQLRQPAWVLGARQILTGLDGTSRFGSWLDPDPNVPFTSDLVRVTLGSTAYDVSASRPFLAFSSETQNMFATIVISGDIQLARRNKHPRQRMVNPAVDFSFERQVRAWYRAVALTQYSLEVQPVLRQVVRSLGSGPWLAGLQWGDSQLAFLAMWLGHAIAAPSWAVGPWDGASKDRNVSAVLPVDYYMYAAFTENPGNQCFVHSGENCKACLQQCLRLGPSQDAYWLPFEAYMGSDVPACAVLEQAFPGTDCGQRGIEHVVAQYASRTASELWNDVEQALQGGDCTKSVFDLLPFTKTDSSSSSAVPV
jgi:hypothetical protein